MPKLFIVVIADWFYLSHRKEIGIAAREAGYDVTIVGQDTGKSAEIERLGLHFIAMPSIRSIHNPLHELYSLVFLYKLYRKAKPIIVHQVGLKIILYGTLAARLNNIIGIVNAVSGLGMLFA
jgi:hypothetical protein